MAGTKRVEVFVDSGAWIALVASWDPLHAHASAAYAQRFARAHLITSSDVYDESVTRLRYDGGLEAARLFRRRVGEAKTSGRVEVLWVDQETHNEAWVLLEQNPSVKLSFTDATSAVIAKRRGVRTVFGFDADFRALGFEVLPSN